jgi:hypothetical protein
MPIQNKKKNYVSFVSAFLDSRKETRDYELSGGITP